MEFSCSNTFSGDSLRFFLVDSYLLHYWYFCLLHGSISTNVYALGHPCLVSDLNRDVFGVLLLSIMWALVFSLVKLGHNLFLICWMLGFIRVPLDICIITLWFFFSFVLFMWQIISDFLLSSWTTSVIVKLS